MDTAKVLRVARPADPSADLLGLSPPDPGSSTPGASKFPAFNNGQAQSLPKTLRFFLAAFVLAFTTATEGRPMATAPREAPPTPPFNGYLAVKLRELAGAAEASADVETSWTIRRELRRLADLDGSRSAPTFAEFRDEVLEYYRAERGPSAFKRIRKVLGQVEGLGVARLDDVNLPVLMRWKEGRSHLAASSQVKDFQALRMVLDQAVKCGYIERSPARIWDLTFRKKGRRPAIKKHLSTEETSRLFRHLAGEVSKGWREHRLFALASTVYLTGMRLGEAQRLRVESIDAEARLIDLRDRELKTSAASEFVAMPAQLSAILGRWLACCGSDWAFPSSKLSGPWLYGSARTRPTAALKLAGEAAGVEGATYLAGRHGWTTHGKGVWNLTAEHVQAQLRHTTPATQENYTHFDPDNQRDLVKSITLPGLENYG
jgi:integrase